MREDDKIRIPGDYSYPACRTFQQVIIEKERGEEKDSKDEKD